MHESWLVLVHGPRKRTRRKVRPREPSPTEPVEWGLVPYPHKRKWFHRQQPPVARARGTSRHDARNEVKPRLTPTGFAHGAKPREPDKVLIAFLRSKGLM